MINGFLFLGHLWFLYESLYIHQQINSQTEGTLDVWTCLDIVHNLCSMKLSSGHRQLFYEACILNTQESKLLSNALSKKLLSSKQVSSAALDNAIIFQALQSLMRHIIWISFEFLLAKYRHTSSHIVTHLGKFLFAS